MVGAAVRVLDAIAGKFAHEWVYQERLMGGCSIDRFGSSLTDETLADCQAADAVLLGAVGGPKWDDPKARDRPERGLLALRKGLGVFANLRPVKVHPALIDSSPLKPEKLQGVDILVIRELTGGLYFGWPKGRDVKDGRERAVDTLEYYDYEIRRVMELAFAWPRDASARSRPSTRPTCWNPRGCGDRLPSKVGAAKPGYGTGACPGGYRRHAPDHRSGRMDVVVTENMFGDILTDEASVLAGSMGMLPSASLGEGRNRLVRTDSRLGPRYRRPGHRQPDRHDSVHRHAAAPLAGPGDGSRRHRKRRRRNHHRRSAHRRPRRETVHQTNDGRNHRTPVIT
jgi:3-isopropylmalate dehydrogenase